MSETTPGSNRAGQEETVASECAEESGWIDMLKHSSQTAMCWKGLGVGKSSEYKHQQEKDWEESPERLPKRGKGWKEGST